MRVIKATHYGFRTVVIVCFNPDDPEYTHDDGSAHPADNVHGCAATGDPEINICHNNHRIEEFTWDGDDQYDANGVLRTADSFWAEIKAATSASPSPAEVSGMVGLER